MNFINKYRNPWHSILNVPKPAFYENNFEVIFEYRGFKIFKAHNKHFDFVIADCCITQRAGFSKETAPEVIDLILNGETPVCEEVNKHLVSLGFKSRSYYEYDEIESSK